MILADSDVLIDFLRGHGEGAERVATELTRGSLATTAITAFELRSGVRTERQRRAVETLLDALTILPFGLVEAGLAAEVRRWAEKQGQPIGMADDMVAAPCLSTASTLLTRNVKHFDRVPGLRLA